MDKTILVTGSSKGLGRELAFVFSEQGYNIILHGRNIEQLAYVEKQVLENGVKCCFIAGDLTKGSTIENLVYYADKFSIDILINNAGIYLRDLLSKTPEEKIRELFEVNVLAPIFLTKRVFEILKKKESGLVININSFAGKNPGEDEPIYSATKHALRGFSTSFAYEALVHNVVVTDVYLGAMSTDMTLPRNNRANMMKPREVAEQIFCLVKDRFSLRIPEINLLRRQY